MVKEWQILGYQILDFLPKKDFEVLVRNIIHIRHAEWEQKQKVVAI